LPNFPLALINQKPTPDTLSPKNFYGNFNLFVFRPEWFTAPKLDKAKASRPFCFRALKAAGLLELTQIMKRANESTCHLSL
jgi:hypothetical protein